MLGIGIMVGNSVARVTTCVKAVDTELYSMSLDRGMNR